MSGPRESLAITRRGDEWTLHKPISGPLDQAEVRKMLDTLVQLRAKEFLDDSAEALADYRLRPAELLIRLGVRPAGQTEGREITLALGRRTNDRAAVYARVLEQPGAFLIDSLDVRPLHDPLFRIRRKQPLSFDRKDITGINVQLPAGTAELTRQGETWAMTHPYKGTADAEQVARLLHKLGSIEAEGFVDNVPPAGLAEYGLDKPRGKITLHRAPGRDPVTLSIGAPSRRGDDTVAVTAGGGTVAWVAQRDADRMLGPPATYWDAALLKVPASDEIYKIALQTPMESSVMELVEGIWLLGLPVRGHTDKEHVQRIVRHLQDLKALRIVSLGPEAAREYVGDTNRISLAVKTRPATTTQPTTAPATRPAAGEKDYIIRMVSRFGKTYVWVDGAKPGAVGVFPGPLYETFSAELRYRKLFSLDPGRIAAVKVLAEDDTFELQRRQTIEGEQWLSPTHPRMHIDTERVRAYLADVLDLYAQRFLSRNSPEQLDFEASKAWLTIELTTAEGKSVHLVVSSKGPKDQTGRFASARGMHGAFVLSGESVAKLARKLRSFESPGR
jgi:hypothetical protein